MNYKSKKCKLENTYEFDSIGEMNYFVLLREELRAGKISDLILQPQFILQEGLVIKSDRTKSGKTKLRNIVYTPDFQYVRDGRLVVVEFKGYATPQYKLRKRLFLGVAKDLGVDEFIEVNYKKIERYFFEV